MFNCYNTLTCTIANEYPSSNEISKKNGTVRGNYIACDALFHIAIPYRICFQYEINFMTCARVKVGWDGVGGESCGNGDGGSGD